VQEGRRQEAEGRRQKAEGRRQKAEGKKACTVSFLTFFNWIVIAVAKATLDSRQILKP
jgi:hypothetical protein